MNAPLAAEIEDLTCCRNRGSYMSAHVLLNLLNELGKRDKMRGLPSILPLFCNELNKLNNTGTWVGFYLSYDIKLILKSYFSVFINARGLPYE